MTEPWKPAATDGGESERIGRVFRSLADEHLTTRRRDDGREVWRRIEDARRRKSTRRFEVRLWAPVLALGVGIGLLWFGLSGRELRGRRLRFVVEGGTGPALNPEQQSSLEGTLIATEEGNARLSFSDESSFVLRPRTTLRVHIDPSERVVSRLTQGTLRVHVRHRDETDYRFRAGEFEVRVVGTSFELGYEPTSKKLSLAMDEGKVLLSLPDGTEKTVVAGEKLELTDGREESKVVARAADRGAEDAPVARSEPESRESAPARTKSVVDLRRLAKAGKFAEIVAHVEREGRGTLEVFRSPADLHEIGQAARYTGRSDLAERAFSMLATRHASSDQGRSASFFLGRITEERGQLGVALGWYERYLRGGTSKFAQEALGRSVVLAQRLRRGEATLALATKYLRLYPEGPYRATAETIVAGAGR